MTLASAASQPRSRRALALRDEAVYMLCGLWMITGLYIDGWAHQANKPETFFTPWHLVLYSGFGAAVVYSGLVALRESRTGVASVLGDDRLTSLGVVLFVAGAVGDFVWHELFGIEVDLEALISPTHLLLMIGGLLMVTMPFRTMTDAEPDDLQTTVVRSASGFLALGVVAFFLMYLMPWGEAEAFLEPYRPGTDGSDLEVAFGMAMVIVSTALFLGAALLLASRERLLPGTATVGLTAVAFAQSGLEGWDNVLAVLGATAAGVVIEALVARGVPLRIVGAAGGAALWSGVFALLHAQHGVEWSPSLWTGAVVFAAMTGVGVAELLSPRGARPASAAADLAR
jgi:hypothetical protein